MKTKKLIFAAILAVLAVLVLMVFNFRGDLSKDKKDLANQTQTNSGQLLRSQPASKSATIASTNNNTKSEPEPDFNTLKRRLFPVGLVLTYENRAISAETAKALQLTNEEIVAANQTLIETWRKISDHQERNAVISKDDNGNETYKIAALAEGESLERKMHTDLEKALGKTRAEVLRARLGPGEPFNYFGRYAAEIWIDEPKEGIHLFHRKYYDANGEEIMTFQQPESTTNRAPPS